MIKRASLSACTLFVALIALPAASHAGGCPELDRNGAGIARVFDDIGRGVRRVGDHITRGDRHRSR